MLIPIGHDQQEVRRLPWVTFAIIALNLVVFLGTGTTGDELQRGAAEAAQRAFEYLAEHPYLEVPDEFMRRIAPGERSREQLQLIIEARKSQVEVPRDRDQRAAEQAELRRLVDAFMSMEGDHPYSKWGLVPSEVSLVALFTSLFMHAGWMHLLGNMFMLYLAGPPVEDAFGRPLFAGIYLAGGVVSALAHVVMFPASTSPLVGASGAIAAVMGVFMVRCGKSNIRFFYWWFFIRAGTFDAPAWLMLPLWLGQQLLYASLTRGEGGVAYWAHVGGFVFGAGAALLVKALGIEAKYIHPAIEKQISLSQHPALDEGMALLVRGETEAARRELRKVLQDDPRNPDARLGMWQSFLHEGRPEQGIDHMVRVIEDELRRKEMGLARDHWLELLQTAGTGGPAQLRWRLASELHATDPAAANDVFRHLAADGTAGLLAEKAAARLGLAPGVAAPAQAPAHEVPPRPTVRPPAPPPPAPGPAPT
ncbi:MAG: rhomboid family intramembrane serine protease, partial [Acidobacteriota bacterium]